MPTLHIEHSIADFDLWQAAFRRFADIRAQAGVLNHRVLRPADDPNYVVIHLDFETLDQATHFENFLRTQVWPSRNNAPALIGTPQTRILQLAD